MQAMILAAGLGTRLRPHTRLRPKPLFPVLDRPLLLRIIDDLRRAGCHRLLVNAFHLRHQITDLLADQGSVRIALGRGPRSPVAAGLPASGRMDAQEAAGTSEAGRMPAENEPLPGFAAPVPVPQPMTLTGPWLAVQPDITVQVEEMELGTGGGLRLARSWFADQPALVVNGDIFHDIDYGRIMEHHRRAGNDATLVLHDFPAHNKVELDAQGNILSFSPPQNKPEAAGEKNLWAFTGIQVIEPALLELIPPQVFYHSIDWYQQLIAQGKKVRGVVVRGHCWSDMGTPQDYLALHARLLTTSGREPFFLGEAVNLGRGVEFADWVAVGSRATLADGVCLRRCVVWDGVTVPAGTVAEDAIFSGCDR